MASPIVVVNVSQTVAPAPSILQRTGAMVTQGGVNTATGTLSLLTEAADLTALLPATVHISAISWAGSVVTVTTSASHGWPTAAVVDVVVAGVTPAAYNGTFAATVVDSTHFTYALASDPGSETVLGTVALKAVSSLQNQVATFFAQGSNTSVYVLNLGADDIADGIVALGTFITANPGLVYSFLLPDNWDGAATLPAFLTNYGSTTAKTYFFIRTTLGNYADYATKKAAFTLIPSPTAPAAEEPAAAAFWRTLSYNPSSSNQVTPLAFSYLYGVTAYPTFGNSAQLATLKAANVNYIGTGAEGGISNTILFWGHMMDGNPFNYWYSVDWVQINADLNVANAVINGSNNPAAPLYYNQDGINRLQAVLARTMSTAVSYGLSVGNIITTQLSQADFIAAFNAGTFAGNVAVNAVPFAEYSALNPSDYSIGKYAGLSVAYSPQLGFEQIIININATEAV